MSPRQWAVSYVADHRRPGGTGHSSDTATGLADGSSYLPLSWPVLVLEAPCLSVVPEL